MKIDFTIDAAAVARKGGKLRLQLILSVEQLEAMLAAARAEGGDDASARPDASRATCDANSGRGEKRRTEKIDDGDDARAPPPPEIDKAFEADWERFRSSYPEGVIDPEKARGELRTLSIDARKLCLAGVLLYVERCRRWKEKPKPAHLFIRRRVFEGLKPESAGGTHFVPAKSPEGRAVAVISALIGNISVPAHWCGRGPDGVTFGYWIGFAIDARMLGLAELSPERRKWASFEVGRNEHGAWQHFLDHIEGLKHRWRVPVEGGRVRVPMRFPPNADGSLPAESPSPSSTGPPRELSEADADELTGSMR